MNFRSFSLLVSFLLLAGCRQEDWREFRFESPASVDFSALQQAVIALDRKTPPVVTLEGTQIVVRYNSMHLSTRNILYVCEELSTVESGKGTE